MPALHWLILQAGLNPLGPRVSPRVTAPEGVLSKAPGCAQHSTGAFDETARNPGRWDKDSPSSTFQRVLY